MQITSSFMTFQKCMCSYKLIEIKKKNWLSLGAIGLFQMSASLHCLHAGLCVITQTLHMWGSFMSFEISSRWWLGVLLFPTPMGCLASRSGCSPRQHRAEEEKQVSQQGCGQSWPDRPSGMGWWRGMKFLQKVNCPMPENYSGGLVNYYVYYGKML